MSGQIIFYGALVERSLDGTAWAPIPECKGVAIPTVETEYVDVTSLDSPNRFREYKKAMKDAGIIAVPCGYSAPGFKLMLADEATDQLIYYRTTLPAADGQSTGDVFEFRGYPTPSVDQTALDEPMSLTVNIRTSGGVDWTEGTTAP